MVLPSDSLEAQLLRLPLNDRARLAELLLASLDADATSASVSPAEVEAAWTAEAERRLADLRAGTVTGIPAAEVFARVTAQLGR